MVNGVVSTGPNETFVQVIPFSGVGRAFSYRVPETLRRDVRLGSLVQVPLRGRIEYGLVVGHTQKLEVDISRMKMLAGCLYPVPMMTPDLLILMEWLQRYYAASYESVLETMVPAVIRKGIAPKVHTFLTILKVLSAAELAGLKRRAPHQGRLYAFLQEQGKPCLKTDVFRVLDVSRSACKALVEKRLIREFSETEERVAYKDVHGDIEGEALVQAFKLNPEQAEAADSIGASIEKNKFQAHLLHGVTGSGKTEVYLDSIRRTLETGGGVLFLVPEVALTPQTVGRLRSRLEALGRKTVVWHSHLSEGERFDAWMSIAGGEAHVVVGARSAVFAPIQNLKLIIVDEEHEPAYKQEESPRYHGRDVAVYRAMLNDAVCVLGSATPSLESLYNTQVKNYQLNKLTKRVDDRTLPTFHVVDMKHEMGKGHVPLSRALVEKLRDRFEKKEQSILFLNRRGFSASLLCPSCGFVACCNRCSTTLTYHRSDEILRCHLCDYEECAPKRCPKCREQAIQWRGSGTQRVEDAVKAILPKARVMRMDADTLAKRHRFREILADFRKGTIDILVGTQMIAKGLDFPNVTLVGMVDADLSLHMPDFRAGERTFQLLVQVAGRAGRGDLAGEVVVQSFTPSSAPLQFARQADFEGFLHAELEQRREFHYPPHRHLIRHIFRGRNPEKVAFVAEQWVRMLEK
ncbi:MAG TPA: primosomal protein N', partial [Opitutae bacterium]|nr:primosomal protein N' [Opitutae bacterium]